MSETNQPAPLPPLSDEQMRAIVGAVKTVMSEIKAVDAVPASSKVVAAAKSLPDLITMAQTAAPDLAAAFIGKALIASKTPWGVLAGAGVSWLVAHYGLACTAAAAAGAGCWTPDTINTVTGAATLFGAWVASYVMRYLSPLPITGILKPATPEQAAAQVSKP